MFRLMIADDEDAERMGIRFLLEKFGFKAVGLLPRCRKDNKGGYYDYLRIIKFM